MSDQKRQIKVLMFCIHFPPNYSGASKQAIALAKELRSLGHQIEFATATQNGGARKDEVDGFLVHRLPRGQSNKHWELRLWLALLRLCIAKRRYFDVLHSHGATYLNSAVGPIALLSGLKSVAKVTLSKYEFGDPKKSLSGRLQICFLKMIHCIVPLTADLKKEATQVGLSSINMRIIPNGVDTKRFRPATKEDKKILRERLGLPLDRLLVLSVGVFDQRKRIGWLVDQWIDNDGFDTDAFLVAVGPKGRKTPQEDYDRILERAKRHQKNVKILDPVSNIEDYYRASDVFVLPSTSEGMPNVILEAMACGLPCVGSRVSGTRDLIADGKNGETFSPNSIEELGEALRRVLGQDMFEMAENARKGILEAFDLKVVARSYQSLYEELLGI